MSLCDQRDGLLENEEMVSSHWSHKDILPSAFSQLSSAIPSVHLKLNQPIRGQRRVKMSLTSALCDWLRQTRKITRTRLSIQSKWKFFEWKSIIIFI